MLATIALELSRGQTKTEKAKTMNMAKAAALSLIYHRL